MDAESNGQQNYAGFGLRFLAYWVDFLILFPLGLVIQSLFGNNIFAVFQAQTLSDLQKVQSSPLFLLNMLVAFGLSFAYWLIFWVNYDGATPGKKLLGIKITRDNGDKLTYSSAFVRCLGFLVSSATSLFFGLGFIWIIWDKKKQALHDKIAGTIVVKTDQKPKTALAVFLALLAMFIFFGYMTASFIKGFQLGFKDVQQKRVTSTVTQPATQLQSEDLASLVFARLNEKRVQGNLPVFKNDQQLCAYTQRRLDQLTVLGKQDDGRGFYEDVANPQISNAYFTQFLKMGTILFTLNPKVASTADDVVNSWFNVEGSTAMAKNYSYGCVRANSQFVVLVAGEHK